LPLFINDHPINIPGYFRRNPPIFDIIFHQAEVLLQRVSPGSIGITSREKEIAIFFTKKELFRQA
jgi:hypothetical protein